MYEVGMYGGSFNPLHLGHVNDIIMAANQCKKLYVVLSVTDDPKEIDHRERYMWLKNVTAHMDNVEVIEIFDKNTSKDTYDWKAGARDIKNAIGKKIDVVFSGDDYEGKHIWEKFYKVDKARTREYGGSGIGLSIVRAIMESMNQSYGVENFANGVAFWFELEIQ